MPTGSTISPEEDCHGRLVRERGLLLRAGGGHTVGFYPSLCITRDEVDEILASLDSSIGELEIELATSD